MNYNNQNINQFKGKQVDITVNHGDSFTSIPFEFWSDDAHTMPIDITANTYSMSVSLGQSSRLTFDMEITSPNILTASTDKIELQQNTYFFDLKETKPDGTVTTFIYGNFNVLNK